MLRRSAMTLRAYLYAIPLGLALWCVIVLALVAVL